jgi:toxin-antitoxin system PIN domain toxin
LKHLLDVNVLLAITQPDHSLHKHAMKWFNTPALNWAMCAVTEAGFVRLTINSNVSKLTLEDAYNLLDDLMHHPGYHYWPITTPWSTLAKPLHERIHGHLQITDALLLGLAIKEKAVLVTLDKAIPYLAGAKYEKHVLLLG